MAQAFRPLSLLATPLPGLLTAWAVDWPPQGLLVTKRRTSLHGPDVGRLLGEKGIEEDARLPGVHPAVGEGVL